MEPEIGEMQLQARESQELLATTRSYQGLPRLLSGRESACPCRKHRGFNPWFGKIPWRRKWQSTTVFLPGNPMGRGAWWAPVHGVAKVGHSSVTKPPYPIQIKGEMKRRGKIVKMCKYIQDNTRKKTLKKRSGWKLRPFFLWMVTRSLLPSMTMCPQLTSLLVGFYMVKPLRLQRIGHNLVTEHAHTFSLFLSLSFTLSPTP